jgi:hypothetical protein
MLTVEWQGYFNARTSRLLLLLLQPTTAQLYKYTPDQHTNNINVGWYMKPQIHAACTERL